MGRKNVAQPWNYNFFLDSDASLMIALSVSKSVSHLNWNPLHWLRVSFTLLFNWLQSITKFLISCAFTWKPHNWINQIKMIYKRFYLLCIIIFSRTIMQTRNVEKRYLHVTAIYINHDLLTLLLCWNFLFRETSVK